MNERSLRALIALNVVLLVGLVLMIASPRPAEAQLGAASEYLMVAGQVVGRTQQHGIYIINLRSGAVQAVFVNSDAKRVERIADYDMSVDLQAQPRR